MKFNLKNIVVSLFSVSIFVSVLFIWSNTAFAANTIVTKKYLDANANGTVEKIRWVMDENVTACAYEAGDWTVNTAGSITVVITGLSCTGTDANLDITVTADASETGGSTAPVISYSQSAGTADSVTLTSGAMTNKTSQSITDGAAPVILSGVFTDNNNDGAVDRIIYTTSTDTGMVCTAYTGNVDMTVNTAGTVVIARNASDSCATNGTSTFTITLATPGASNITGGGTLPIVTYTQPGNGLEDGTGNDVPTKSSLTLADNALPIVVTLTPTNASVNQSKTADIVVVFSEPMTTGSLTFSTSPTETYTPTWSNSDKTLNEAHGTFRSGGHQYTVTLTGLTDASAATNALYGNPYSWTFYPKGGTSPFANQNNDVITNNVVDNTPSLIVTQIPVEEVPIVTPASGCSSGNTINNSTGAPCVNNVGNDHQTSSVKYNLGTVTLKAGSTGPAAKELQRFLNDKLNLGLKLDGKIGPKTIAVIKKWQKDHGLKADGLIGPKTKALMNSMAN